MAYDLPAIITCTAETHPGDYPDGRKNPLPVPESEDHVHLTVFTPGGYGTQVQLGHNLMVDPQSDADFVGARGFKPGSGTYVELNVPYSGSPPVEQAGVDWQIPSRSWRWPDRTA